MIKYLFYIVIATTIFIISCNESPYMQGKRLYTANCQNCHMEDGSGLVNLIPSLSISSSLADPAVFCIIMNGVRDTIKQDSNFLVKEMPAFKQLSGTEITNIVNYIQHRWSNDFKEVTIIEAEQYIKNCIEHGDDQ